jgi:hypothetical protein
MAEATVKSRCQIVAPNPIFRGGRHGGHFRKVLLTPTLNVKVLVDSDDDNKNLI